MESQKTLQIWDDKIKSLLVGQGIDIGCGQWPILPTARRFDIEDGDANRVTDFVHEQFDYVFSSHCLEHMHDPYKTIQDWFKLVRTGGHLIVIVPDEDLYEQGCFPSIFNVDHKWTFTISKTKSWSPKSVNILNLVATLPGQLKSVELQDFGYDRRLMKHNPGKWAHFWGRKFMQIRRQFSKETRAKVALWFARMGAVIEQTAVDETRLAQIQFIVKKL